MLDVIDPRPKTAGSGSISTRTVARMELTRGWHTDLAVLRLTGSTVEPHPDHLVVRSPHNPSFHWGNFVLVTEAGDADDAARWAAVFRDAFPDADHVAIGLPRVPSRGPWEAAGLLVDTDEVLYTTRLPEQRPLPDGYRAGAFRDDDWEALVHLDLAENARTKTYGAVGHERFLRDSGRARRDLVARGAAQWFGAFDGEGSLVSALGIVLCDGIGRYQSVGTHVAHRGRGLAGHLLGLAARWAGERGVSCAARAPRAGWNGCSRFCCSPDLGPA